MKIGILGTRGIPNAYGGFEQFAQYLAQGLQKKGHVVYVYNSDDHPYQDSEWRGVHIVHCRDWENKIGTAGQFIYDYNCLRDAAKRNFDVLLQLGYTSNSVWHFVWPKKALNVVNMDGLEWKRSKYGWLTRKFLKWAEARAVKYGDILIADSTGIKQYILDKYGRESIYIPYGAEIPSHYDSDVPAKWGLKPFDYHLLIARMEPENNIEMVIQGWMGSQKEKPLVLMGNTGNAFGQYLVKNYRHENLRFIGAIYDQMVVNSLRHYASLYLHGHSVGGTNPSLLEAMACGCEIVAHDNSFNRAILEGDADYFSSAEELMSVFDHLPDPETVRSRKEKNEEKIRTLYNWDKIIDAYEKSALGGQFFGKYLKPTAE